MTSDECDKHVSLVLDLQKQTKLLHVKKAKLSHVMITGDAQVFYTRNSHRWERTEA